MEYTIPQLNWAKALLDAMDEADEGDTIIVRNEAQHELATRSAGRMGCNATIVINESPEE